MTKTMDELRGDAEDMNKTLHDRERESNDKEERIRVLVGDTTAKDAQLCELKRDIQDKTERIGDHEKIAKAKTKQMSELITTSERDTQRIEQLRAEKSANMQCIEQPTAQLTAVKTAKQKKVKHSQNIHSVCTGCSYIASPTSTLYYSTAKCASHCLYLVLECVTVGSAQSNYHCTIVLYYIHADTLFLHVSLSLV